MSSCGERARKGNPPARQQLFGANLMSPNAKFLDAEMAVFSFLYHRVEEIGTGLEEKNCFEVCEGGGGAEHSSWCDSALLSFNRTLDQFVCWNTRGKRRACFTACPRPHPLASYQTECLGMQWRLHDAHPAPSGTTQKMYEYSP